jgi:hypothetical protein
MGAPGGGLKQCAQGPGVGSSTSTVCPGATEERSGLYTWYGAHAQWSITLSRETPVLLCTSIRVHRTTGSLS